MMTEVFTHNYGHFDLLPNEMVINILISIDVNTLFDCRLVCKRWQKLIDTYVFQEKAFRENKFVNNGQGYYSFSQISANDVRRLDLPWYVFYIICKYDPFNRNLVKNHCGQYGWKYWESNNDSFSSQNDLNCFWTVEQIPQSAHLMLDDSNFDGHTSCFSSYEKRSLTKDQEIVFKDHGLNDNIMKTLQPQIAVSAW